MKVLVTGIAGFIGYHLARRLLDRGDEVVGIDNLNDYYDVRLKESRLERLLSSSQCQFHRLDLADGLAVSALVKESRPHRIVNLAAQAGVRHSLTHPHAYVETNVTGFLNVLEAARHCKVEHLVFASSSSVYGGNHELPFSTEHRTDSPLSLYAASKRANELMAHAYSHLYEIPCTGLRFFSVYGPWGRPDMALFQFTRAILEGRPIDVYNDGRLQRDFTYIDDIVEGTVRVLDKAPAASPRNGYAAPPACRLYNIGTHQPVELLHFIEILENCLGRKASKVFLPLQPGDVPATFADVTELQRDFGFSPSTPISVGVARFVDWYREYYAV
ncbi:MAG: NAD-dependent epimerase [Armatimonadetes bacterium]|nr:NAD-dependent epimerase [Armatimonadota bacterium]